MMIGSVFAWTLLTSLVGLIGWIASASGNDLYSGMSPLEIAGERHPLGEIDDETYEQIRAHLKLA